MKFDWKQPGYITSAIAHLALLLAALLAFSDTQKFDDAQESIAVEVISEAQLNDVTKGEKSVKDIKLKPKVDKISEAEVQKPTPPTPLAKTDVPTPVPPLKPQIDPGQDAVPDAKPVPTPPVKPVEPPKPEIKPDSPKPEPRPAPEPPVSKSEPKPEPVKPLPAPPVPKPVIRPQPDAQNPEVPDPEAEVVRPAPPKTQDLAKLIEKTTPPDPPKPKVRPRDKMPAAEAPDKNALKQQIDAAAEKAKLEQKLADDAAKEKAILDKAVKDKAARDSAARDLAARDLAARDLAAKDTAAKDMAVKDAATKQAALDKAADVAQEKADKEKADKEKADKEKAARAVADKSAVDKAAALLKPKAGDISDAPKKDVLGDISKFLSKDKPQNTGSSGKVASADPAAGTTTASAAKMSPNLKAQLNGWLKDKYHACWSLPITLPTGSKYVPKIQVTFNSDGSLAGAPRLANPPADPAFNSLAASAKAAVVNPDCNPLKIPPHFQAFFNEWKDSTISFDLEDQ